MGSFGDWVRRRRKLLDITQADLARKVSCSLSMLRKIERDERRPSQQLAELLADHLAIDPSQREFFTRLARGEFVLDIPELIRTIHTPIPIPIQTEFAEHPIEQVPFVARERQLQLLHSCLGKAMQGQGQMVFVAGEAGQGKTSLLVEFARQAMDARPELIIAGGSCDVYTGQGDPLLPFQDILRMLVGDTENAGLPGLINRNLATRLAETTPVFTEILLNIGTYLIGTLLSEVALETRLAQSFPHNPKNTELLLRLQSQGTRQAPEAMRVLHQDRLFDEISTVLKALAQQGPLILMLDDLHWIDPSSAALLGHLVMRLKYSPILMIGSYRPEELAQGRPDGLGNQIPHPLQEVLSESLRQFGHNRIDLDYSGPGEELDFVNALLGINQYAFGETFRKQLTRLTEGQPLFVVELLKDMQERGDIFQGKDGRWQEAETMNWESLPARVEGVIEKRIVRLPADLLVFLTAASVQGETFFAEIVARVTQSDPRDLTRRLSVELDRQHRLIHAQGIVHAGAERLSQYRFQHYLFQHYLYERLSAAERMYLHEAVGNAMEALIAGNADAEDVPASQLARHFQEARLGLKASQYLLLAGQKAARVLAFDEAIVFFERGISLLKNLARTSEISRLEFETSLAHAHALWHNGRVVEATGAYQKAFEIARTLDDPTALARAALAYEEPRWRLNLDAGPSQSFMREALVALGEVESGLRVRLLVGLSRSLLASDEREELRTTVDKALRIARHIDDPLALCDALRIMAHIDRRPEMTDARLSAAQELIATAESIGDQERLADGLDLAIYDLLELGEIEQVDQMIAAQSRAAQEIKQPFQLHVAAVFQTMRAILRGEFENAERLANEAADISQQIGIAELDGILGIQMFTIRREQGRIHEIAPIVKLLVTNNPKSSAWRPGLALIYSILDQRKECQAIFEELVSDGVAWVAQDALWVASLAYLSEECAYLGDAIRADILYPLLLPYQDRAVVVGGATACFGAVGRYLGLLAKTRSDWEMSERHFEEALRLDGRMQAWPWLAHSQSEYAAMLLKRGQKADRERAHALLNEALTAAQRMDMAALVPKITNLMGNHMIERE